MKKELNNKRDCSERNLSDFQNCLRIFWRLQHNHSRLGVFVHKHSLLFFCGCGYKLHSRNFLFASGKEHTCIIVDMSNVMHTRVELHTCVKLFGTGV